MAALDAASIRRARFGAISEIGYPARGAAAQILATYLRGLHGFERVETEAVAAHFGPEISGADIREIVRRSVLSTGAVGQADLISTVQSGRFKPRLPQSNYL